jgi:peptidoglycan/xylan/chitin deacetylase (PgdA/CDA1 family)
VSGPVRDLVGYGRRPPRARWPDDARVVVNFVLVYEEGSEYSVLHGDDRNDGWGEYAQALPAPQRDLGNETHYDYGSRAGVWRLARLADEYGIPVTVSGTAVALEQNPDVVAWMRERDHDLLAHGLRWIELWTLGRDEERRQLHDAIDRFERLFGARPVGWNSRTQPSEHTRELLIEAGFLYDSDACDDDLPHFATVEGGARILIVPYTKTQNDSRYLMTPGYGSPRDYADQCRMALDELLREATTHPKMMTVVAHARWSGQPARTAPLREFVEHALAADGVRFMRRVDIARWWLDHHERFAR